MINKPKGLQERKFGIQKRYKSKYKLINMLSCKYDVHKTCILKN